jgi:hypothetical protein
VPGKRFVAAQVWIWIMVNTMALDLHRRQDLRSLDLHRAAVRVLTEHPERVQRVLEVLAKWEKTADTHSQTLRTEWRNIVEKRAWHLALEESDRGQQLRQASPLAFVLDKAQRSAILERWRRNDAAGQTTMPASTPQCGEGSRRQTPDTDVDDFEPGRLGQIGCPAELDD